MLTLYFLASVGKQPADCDVISQQTKLSGKDKFSYGDESHEISDMTFG